jgi:hypothetical protein
VYGVARHENAHVACEVEAYPPPDSFKWSFNNTAETIDVPQARYRTSAATSGSSMSQSMLTYTPVTEMDYGTVMCWANNMAGQQKEPCVFHIIAAGSKFSDPSTCTVLYVLDLISSMGICVVYQKILMNLFIDKTRGI